jgi:hypothetical protein
MLKFKLLIVLIKLYLLIGSKIKTKMKKSFLMVCVVAALVSCTKSEVDSVNAGDVEIGLGRPSIIDASGVVSRAPFEGAISNDNTLKARVIASITEAFTGSPLHNGIMDFRGNSFTNYETPSSTTTFPSTPQDPKVYLYGVYPADTWTFVTTPPAKAEFTFTGKEDVMAAGKVETLKSEVAIGTYKTLNFKHLLTRLEVKLSASSDAISKLGDVSSIKLIGDELGAVSVNSKVAVVPGGTATFTSVASPVTSLSFYKLTDGTPKVYTDNVISTYTLTLDPTLVAYSLVAPVDAVSGADAKEYYLEITTTNSVKTIGVDLNDLDGNAFSSNTAGRAFTVSIVFRTPDQIAVNAEITPWEEEGEWQGEIIVQ